MIRLLIRIVVCAWTHGAWRTEKGHGAMVEVRCDRCDECWMEPRW